MANSRLPVDPEKKARVITAAMHEFAHHGYRGAKTDVIAQAASVSKGLVFNYFGSKSALYLAVVEATFAAVMQNADFSVWQDAPDLKTMVYRALRYKIELQLANRDEFTFMMQAYASVGNLPADLQQQVREIWAGMATTNIPDMIKPVINRLPLRAGVSVDTVVQLSLMISDGIGEQAKVMIQANPEIQIADFEPLISQAVAYMDILEHGFMQPE